MVIFVPQQASKAVGVSNVQPVPHSTVLGPAQLTMGGLVSVMVMISVQKAELEQQSVAFQVKVMISLQGTEPLVTALKMVTLTAAQQASTAVGGVSTQPPGVPAAVPH